MYTLPIPELKSFVRHIAVDQNDPVMIWGKPGVGKSESIRQLTEELSALLVDIRLSQYDSVDLRGFPGVDEATSLTRWHAPSTLPFVGNPAFPADKPIILFLDEINAAAPAVSAVAYQLVNERCVGEHKLLPNVRVVAAGNREGDRGVTNRMPLPLANRFVHCEAEESVDAYCAWHAAQGLPAIGVAFLHFRRELLSTFDPTKTEKVFATPRTWAKAFRYYASDVPMSVKRAAMAGAVGDGPAAEFWGFVDVWQSLISIEEIIANPSTAATPERADMSYATAVNVSGHMARNNIEALNTYLKRLPPEYAVLAWNLALLRDDDLFFVDEYLVFAKEFREVFRGG
jgi:hypothetical protein